MEDFLPYIGGIFIAAGTIIGVYYSVSSGNEVDIKQKEIKKLNQEIKSLGESNQSLISQNLKLSETIKNLNTGGSGFINISSLQIRSYEEYLEPTDNVLDLQFTLFNNGNYAFDNLKIRAFKLMDYLSTDPTVLYHDLLSSKLNIYNPLANSNSPIWMPKPNENHLPELDYNQEVFKPGQAVSLGPIKFKKDFNYFGINLFIETKRQDFIMLIRFKKTRDELPPYHHLSRISRVFKVNGIKGLEELDLMCTDNSFPKFDDGSLKWFKAKMPKDLF